MLEIYRGPTELCAEMERLYAGLGQYAACLEVQAFEGTINVVRTLRVPYDGVPEDAPVRAPDATEGFVYRITHASPDEPKVLTTIETIRCAGEPRGIVRGQGWKRVVGYDRHGFELMPYEKNEAVALATKIAREGTPNTAANAPHLPWSVVVGEEAGTFYDVIDDTLRRGYGIQPWEIVGQLSLTPDRSSAPASRQLEFVTLKAEPQPDRRIPGTQVLAVAAYSDEFAVSAQADYTPEHALAALTVCFTQGDQEGVTADSEARQAYWASLVEHLQPENVTFTRQT